MASTTCWARIRARPVRAERLFGDCESMPVNEKLFTIERFNCGLVLCLCIFTSYLAGIFDGFDRGTTLYSGILSSEGTGYTVIAGCYSILTLSSILLFVRIVFRLYRWSSLALLCAICFSAYSFYYLVRQKLLTLAVESEYTRLMRDAIGYDLLFAAILIYAIGYEIYMLVRIYRISGSNP
jgi:hypothetical protein